MSEHGIDDILESDEGHAVVLCKLLTQGRLARGGRTQHHQPQWCQVVRADVGLDAGVHRRHKPILLASKRAGTCKTQAHAPSKPQTTCHEIFLAKRPWWYLGGPGELEPGHIAGGDVDVGAERFNVFYGESALGKQIFLSDLLQRGARAQLGIDRLHTNHPDYRHHQILAALSPCYCLSA